jgi:hypothetical protein
MVFVHRRVIAQSTFHRSTSHVVLNTEALVGLQFAVFPLDGDADLDGAARRQQDRPDLVRQAEHIGGLVEIEMAFSEHVSSPEIHRGGTPWRH